MEMGEIRVGFIGCGANARGHMRQVLEIPEVEVVGLCDLDPLSLGQAQEQFAQLEDKPTFRDYRKMLERVEMDAVEISTPHTLHFDLIVAALDRGLHVLTEKPMVCTVDHARQVIRKAEEAGKILMISYQRHLAPQFRYVRSQIMAGELGEVQFVAALQDQKWYEGARGAWRQQLALSGGGQLNDSGSHLLDIVLWMTGLEVEEVQAYMEYFDSEVDINSALCVRFKGGALGNLSVVGRGPARGIWEDITIWGSKAAFYMRNGHITYKTAHHPMESFEPGGFPAAISPDRNFVDAILGKDEVQVPALCGLRVIQLTEAAWESARRGIPVKVKG